MFSFLKKKVSISKSGILSGFTDWHCHILPGVDDGFKTMEDSLKVLEKYEREGVTSVWLTPHIMEDMPNETDVLRARFLELQSAYDAKHSLEGSSCSKISLHLASENMLDNVFEKRFEAKDLLPYDGNKLLVETSYYTPPMNMTGILDSIKRSGYLPVLAHPERYVYMDDRYYDSLKDRGILFQMNITSITGFYGRSAQMKAEMLLKKHYYNYFGTDLHRESVFDTLVSSKIEKSVVDQLSFL